MADTTAHTVKSFDDDISQLRSIITRMGGLCELQISAAVDALVTRNVDAAMQVVADDKRIDALEAEAEALAVRIIALRAPLAGDLREIVAALKIAGVLERMGDYAKNIAKRASALAQAPPIEPVVIVPEMARAVVGMIRDVLDAFVDRDADLARAVCLRDKQDLGAHGGFPLVNQAVVQSGRAKVDVSSLLGRSRICSPVTAKCTISPTDVA